MSRRSSSSSARGAPAARSTPASSRRSPGCSSIPSSCSASSASPPAPTAAPCTGSRDVELASRLSFFLWSSIPDEELLEVAARGTAAGSCGARAAGPADAGRCARLGARHQFRRPVAAAAKHPRGHAGRQSVPGVRRQPAGGDAARDRAVRREPDSRGPPHRRAAGRRTIRSSTSASRATTGSRAFTAAISGASRLPTTAAAVCSDRARF